MRAVNEDKVNIYIWCQAIHFFILSKNIPQRNNSLSPCPVHSSDDAIVLPLTCALGYVVNDYCRDKGRWEFELSTLVRRFPVRHGIVDGDHSNRAVRSI